MKVKPKHLLVTGHAITNPAPLHVQNHSFIRRWKFIESLAPRLQILGVRAITQEPFRIFRSGCHWAPQLITVQHYEHQNLPPGGVFCLKNVHFQPYLHGWRPNWSDCRVCSCSRSSPSEPRTMWQKMWMFWHSWLSRRRIRDSSLGISSLIVTFFKLWNSLTVLITLMNVTLCRSVTLTACWRLSLTVSFYV